jgi:8-oxo-dGTP pyrophosphatase MutT (NUDIX family)
MSVTSISVDQAKKDKLFYVVANMAIVDVANAKVLILQRSATEKVHSGKWALPGGKLEHDDIMNLLAENGNAPIDGVDNILGQLAKREAAEECGLNVSAESAKVLSDKVFIRPDNIPVFMTVLSAVYTGGDIKLEEGAFSDYAWVGRDEVASYDLIEGLDHDIEQALATQC